MRRKKAKKRKAKVVKTRSENRLSPWTGRKCPKCGSIRTCEMHPGSRTIDSCYDCDWEQERG